MYRIPILSAVLLSCACATYQLPQPVEAKPLGATSWEVRVTGADNKVTEGKVAFTYQELVDGLTVKLTTADGEYESLVNRLGPYTLQFSYVIAKPFLYDGTCTEGDSTFYSYQMYFLDDLTTMKGTRQDIVTTGCKGITEAFSKLEGERAGK